MKIKRKQMCFLIILAKIMPVAGGGCVVAIAYNTYVSIKIARVNQSQVTNDRIGLTQEEK